jgi:hypothetical protein
MSSAVKIFVETNAYNIFEGQHLPVATKGNRGIQSENIFFLIFLRFSKITINTFYLHNILIRGV